MAPHVHDVPETMFANGDVFEYAECAACGSLQLVDVPHDLSVFYPEDYYSFEPSQLQRLKDEVVVRSDRISDRLGRFRRLQSDLAWMSFVRADRTDSILDVGCGSGRMLRRLERHGFAGLAGTDPFIGATRTLPRGTTIHNQRLVDLHDTFDVIMFNHSFEHTPDPDKALVEARTRLRPGGRLLIRIPVVAEAWRIHGVHWIQLDAPRHVHLQTVDGFRQLAARCGFVVTDTRFDSGPFQIWGSLQAEQGIGLFSPESQANTRYSRSPTFGPLEMRRFRAEARRRNRDGVGDQAGFLLDVAT